MERTAMFIKMLFDSIANLEAKLGIVKDRY